MSEELIVSQEAAAGLQKYDAAAFDAVSKSGDFLARLQLFGGNSEAVKEQRIPIAHWGLVHDATRIDDLGNSTDIGVIAWRPKALRIDKESNAVMSYFDLKNPEFGRIQIESNEQNSGCMFGPEFLVWIGAKGCFATLYLGSKTARREAPRLLPLLHKAATLKAKLIKGAKFSWHGPVVTPCTTPLASKWDDEEFAVQVEKFNNPKDSVVEKADDAGGRER